MHPGSVFAERGVYLMNKQELVAVVGRFGDMTEGKAGEVLDAVFEAITTPGQEGRRGSPVGFGTFSTSKRKAGKGATRARARRSRSRLDQRPLQGWQGLRTR
jgi:nucleoid DNA-binding protein